MAEQVSSDAPDKGVVVRFPDGKEYGLWQLLKKAALPVKEEPDANVKVARMALGRMGWELRDDGDADAAKLAKLQAALEKNPTDIAPWRDLIRWHVLHDPPDDRGKAVKALTDAAKMHGIDPKLLQGENVGDLLQQVTSLLELGKDQIAAIESQLVNTPETDGVLKKEWKLVTGQLFALQAKCRTSFLRYCLYVGRTQLSPEQLKKTQLPEATKRHGLLCLTEPHQQMAAVLLHAERGLIEAPPRHTKSDLVQHYVAYHLTAIDQNATVAYVTASEEDAKGRIEFIRKHFTVDNDMGRRHRALFEDSMLAPTRDGPDNAMRFNVVRSVISNQPSVNAASFAATVIGRGYSLLVLDDILNERDFNEPATRTRHRMLLDSEWLQRMNPGSRALLLGYPWHADDAVEMVKRRADWTVLLLPVGPNFEPLMPLVRSQGWLRRQHAADPINFSRQYWLRPWADSDRRVRRLRYYDPESMVGRVVEGRDKATGVVAVWASIDPAISEKLTADYTAIVRGVLYGGRLYVTHAWRKRLAMADAERWIHETAADPVYGFTDLVIEGVGGYRSVAEHAIYKLPARIRTNIVKSEIKGKGTRLSNCAAMIEMGQVLFRGRHVATQDSGLEVDPELGWLRDEIVNFVVEGAGHDDGMDATVRMIEYTRHELTGDSIPEAVAEAEDDRFAEYRRAERELLSGKNRKRDDGADEYGNFNLIPMESGANDMAWGWN